MALAELLSGETLGESAPAPPDRMRTEYAAHGYSVHCQMVPLELYLHCCPELKLIQGFCFQLLNINGEHVSLSGKGRRKGEKKETCWKSSKQRLGSTWLGNRRTLWEFHAAVLPACKSHFQKKAPDSMKSQRGTGSGVSPRWLKIKSVSTMWFL